MNENIKLSIIICTWNRANFLPKCFHALETQTMDLNSFEVIVVDNNSTDNTSDVVKEYAEKSPLHISYVMEKEQGISAARNTGMKYAKSDYLLFLDDDAIVYSDALQYIYTAFEETGADAVGGQLYCKEDNANAQKAFIVGYKNYGETRQIVKGASVAGAFMGIKKSFALKIGGFSTELGYKGNKKVTWEDEDFFYRLHLKGGVFVWEPNAKCDHVMHGHHLSNMQRAIDNYSRGVSDMIKLLSQKDNLFIRIKLFTINTAKALVWLFIFILVCFTFSLARISKYFTRIAGDMGKISVIMGAKKKTLRLNKKSCIINP